MAAFDLLIVGGGAAGFAAATRASELGIKTALINTGLPLGGTCVNVGCVPSKLLLEVGSENYNLKNIRFRANESENYEHLEYPDFQSAMRAKDRTVTALRNSNYTEVARKLGIAVITGKARFVSSRQIEVNGRILEANRFIIATGSRPRILPFKGIEKVHYITNREALSLSRLPKSMIVVGAGPTGWSLPRCMPVLELI